MNDADWLRKAFRGKLQRGCMTIPLVVLLVWWLS